MLGENVQSSGLQVRNTRGWLTGMLDDWKLWQPAEREEEGGPDKRNKLLGNLLTKVRKVGDAMRVS